MSDITVQFLDSAFEDRDPIVRISDGEYAMHLPASTYQDLMSESVYVIEAYFKHLKSEAQRGGNPV